MKKPHIVLVTYYDEPFREIGALSAASMKRYADMHGYDVRIERHSRTERPVSWNKIPIIRSLFDEGYEFVFWIDADAVITDYGQDIGNAIRHEKDLYAVRVAYEGGVIPSMGIILIRNSPWSRALLAAMWEKSEYTHHHLWENMAFCDITGLAGPLSEDILRLLPRAVRVKKPDPAYMEKIEWLPENWNWVWPGKHIAGRPVIKHYPATPMHVRRYMMSRDLAAAGLLPFAGFMRVFGSTAITHAREKARAIRFFHLLRVCAMMLRDLASALAGRLFP